MFECEGDDLIHLLEKLNIETGSINPYVIKGWFDTDCHNLLNWICSSITENNYVSAQQNSEYELHKNMFTDEELEKEVENIKVEFPDLFDYDSNLFEIELNNNLIDVLKEQLKDYENQLQVNQYLNENLSLDLSRLTSEEIKINLEKETAQKLCLNLGNNLGEINSKTFEQVSKYHTYLNNYEFAEIPQFINNVDLTGLEEKFTDSITWVNSVLKVDDDLLDTTGSFVALLSQLKNRLFHSRVSSLAVQMEVETFIQVQNFLDNYDVTAFHTMIDCDAIQLNIGFNRSQQNCLLKVIEESSLKLTAQYVNQPTIEFIRNELNFNQSRLNYVKQIRESLTKFLSHCITTYYLYLQEKIDISSSNKFFRNIIHYINKELQDSMFRKEAMVKVISDHENFTANPLEDRSKLLKDLIKLSSKTDKLSLNEVLDEITSVRNEIQRLEKKHFSCVTKDTKVENWVKNMQILHSFLTGGPTSRIISIPQPLKLCLSEVNSNLETQNAFVKSLIQITQKTKEKFSQNKWLVQRRQLWMHFITDCTKMFAVIDQLKDYAEISRKMNT